ncbi:MAG: bifunctional metallophosphatase/5'-nucleotidase [Mycobacteriales bacterium]
MTIPILRRTATVTAAALALAGLAAAPATAAPAATTVRLIGLNDFHGNLEPPAGSSGRVVLSNGSTVNAGGAAFLATHVRALRAAMPNSLVLSGGDNIGASPLASALFHDEPTIEFLNSIGTSASAVGNHELDEGYAELGRIQDGGCHPIDGCQFHNPYPGADFPFLASNITFEGSGLPATQPYTIENVAGMPIGIIGATLRDLPTIVSAEGIKGLAFGDEATAINKSSNELQKLGVKAQVVVIHQGDSTVGANGPNDCNLATGGALSAINARVSPNVDAIISGHTHTQYNCQLPDPAGQLRTVIQSLSFGRLLSVLDLSINARSKDVIRSRSTAENVVVTRTVTPDPDVQAIVSEAVTKSAPIANRRVGTITADIVRAARPSGESPLGNLIADSQLAATQSAGAQIALMNPGGVRTDLTYTSSSAGEGDGVVTYGETFAVQPFSNILQTLSYTGAQIDAVLEQQWLAGGPTRILQPSATLHYTQTLSAPIGDRVSDITINAVPLDPAATYRVTVNNFLAGGGDSFTVLTQGTNVSGGPIDLDAFTAYLTANSPVAPPATDRIAVA